MEAGKAVLLAQLFLRVLSSPALGLSAEQVKVAGGPVRREMESPAVLTTA